MSDSGSLWSFIRGTCSSIAPPPPRKWKVVAGLLHLYEITERLIEWREPICVWWDVFLERRSVLSLDAFLQVRVRCRGASCFLGNGYQLQQKNKGGGASFTEPPEARAGPLPTARLHFAPASSHQPQSAFLQFRSPCVPGQAWDLNLLCSLWPPTLGWESMDRTHLLLRSVLEVKKFPWNPCQCVERRSRGSLPAPAQSSSAPRLPATVILHPQPQGRKVFMLHKKQHLLGKPCACPGVEGCFFQFSPRHLLEPYSRSLAGWLCP